MSHVWLLIPEIVLLYMQGGTSFLNLQKVMGEEGGSCILQPSGDENRRSTSDLLCL